MSNSKSTETSPTTAPLEPVYENILFAVHGIGDQMRNETVRAVATRFAVSPEMQPSAFAPQPLGYFYREKEGLPKVRPMDLEEKHAKIGFAEVYWADIPSKVVEEKHTLEEIKAWGETVVARTRRALLRYRDRLQKENDPTGKFRDELKRLQATDLTLAAEVIEEIVDTIQILENLSWFLEKTTAIKFDLREVLDDYVGDVQLVTEFESLRLHVIATLYRALDHVWTQQKEAREGRPGEAHPPLRIHIVAHSEGTVIAFLALLHALSGQEVAVIEQDKLGGESKLNGRSPEWLGSVHGFMTIGSPIDKHLLLWEELTVGLDLKAGQGLFRDHKIKWRNYFDYGDPVGFRLETARKFLDDKGDEAFEFCNCKDCWHDLGFARYVLPGKAHNDYWDDDAVFDHFIQSVVFEREVNPPPPWVTKNWGSLATVARGSVSRWWAKLMRRQTHAEGATEQKANIPHSKFLARAGGVSLAYIFSFFLLAVGTWLLYKAVTEFTHPNMDLLQRYVTYRVRGVVPDDGGARGWDLFCRSMGLMALIAGTTMASRLPRLAIGMIGWAIFWWCLGATLYLIMVADPAREAIGQGVVLLAERIPLPAWLDFHLPDSSYTGPGTIGTLLISVIVVFVGLTSKNRTGRRGLAGAIERKHRWIRRGARPLILTGAAAILLLVSCQMYESAPNRRPANEKPGAKAELQAGQFSPEEQAKLLAVSPHVWPVLVSGIIFLYLWWLSTLVFDLSFVWNRYVRGGVALIRLRHWTGLGYQEDGSDQEKCRNKARIEKERAKEASNRDSTSKEQT